MNSVKDLPSIIRRPEPAGSSASGRQKPIGAILLDAGLIHLDDVDRIVSYGRDNGLRFGDAAVALGVVQPDALRDVLAFQFDHPVATPGRSSISPEVVAAYHGNHPVLDDFRALRNQIQLRWLSAEDRHNRSIAVLSLGRREGRSFLAANLAVAFAQMGQRTLLIDADMRNPRQHLLFGIPSEAGLSGMLAGRIPPVAQRLPELRDLSVIPCGGVPPNPNELLARRAFEDMLATFEACHDVVIIDTPAVEAGPESKILASQARGVVLAACQRRTRFERLRAFALGLPALGASVIGSILMQA